MRKLSWLLGLLVVVALVPGILPAQDATTITGRVTSDVDAPISGAAVSIAALNIGTLTRADGSYMLIVPAARVPAGQQVQVTAQIIGYRPQTVSVTTTGGTVRQDFRLASDVLELEGIVATGIGQTVARERLGVSIASVSGEAVTRVATPNVVNAMAGKAPNVEIISSGGEPGAGTYIRIRGVNTIEGTGEPLFVVDGVPMNNQQLDPAATVLTSTVTPNRASDLNPNDIESIEILKGAAAAAIYGARAANGVVLITTRRGQAGSTRASLTSTITIDQVNRRVPLQRTWDQGAIDGGDTVPGIFSWGRRIPATTPTYDQFGMLFRDGRMFDNNLQVSGGSDRTTYFLSYGRLDHRGIMVGPNSFYDRNSVRVSGSHRLLDNLNVTGNISYVETSGSFIQQGSNVAGLFLGGLRTPPTFDNSQYQSPEGFHRSYRLPNPTAPGGSRGYDNPFFVLYEHVNTAETGRAYGNVGLAFTPIDWLALNYTLGADFTADNRTQVFPISTSSDPTGAITRATYVTNWWDSNLLATATRDISDRIGGSLTLGWNLNSRDFRQNQVRGTNFVTPLPYSMNNTVDQTPSEFQSLIHTESYFGQAQVDLMDQLFLTAALRNDGFSTFGQSERRHWFPKVSAAWNFTETLGMARGEHPLLSFGKLRAAWGQAGNEPPVYGTVSALVFAGTLGDAGWLLNPNGLKPVYGGRGGVFYSITRGQENLRPERTSELELGLDVSLLRERLGLEFTWYNAHTRDAILNSPLAPSTGFFQQLANAAELRNRGFEVGANMRVYEAPRFSWSAGVNWSTNDNRVLELIDDVEFVTMFGAFAGAPGAAVKGDRVGVIRGSTFYTCGDLPTTGAPAEITSACANAPTGAIYVGDDGRPVLDPRVRVIGDPHPDWMAGIRNEFTFFNNLRLFTLIDIKHGGDVWNGTKGALYHWGTHADTDMRGQTMTYADLSGNAVTGPGANTAFRVDHAWFQGLGSGFGDVASQFIEDGGYTKLREIALSYSLPANFTQRLGLSGVDLRVAGRNLYTWTNYTGIDPETNLGGNTNLRGVDYFNNPQTRSWVFTVGLNR
jgi:TonB-linked SusC/RagA family outer membrane protein